jgi:hypothetical protein
MGMGRESCCRVLQELDSREDKGKVAAETCLNYMDISWANKDNQKCVRKYNPENI